MEMGGPTRELVAGASVSDEVVPFVERRFWVYDGPLEAAALNPTFEALEAEFEGSGDAPLGLAMMVADRAEIERRPEPVWPDTELMFAGYTEDDRQLRIRYFQDARIGPALPAPRSLEELARAEYRLQDDYRVLRLAESGDLGVDDVLAFWEREGAVVGEEALRRVHQVELVGIAEREGVVGVASAYLERNPQLRMDLWHYRTYVAEAHRHGHVAAQLLFGAVDLLERRFTGGEDQRGGGIIFELENATLMQALPMARWPQTGFTFVGENGYGHHVRVRYFPGATVPPPHGA